jgi:hypothetical protein
MAAPAVTQGLRRTLLTIAAVVAAVTSASCSDALFGSGRGGTARIALQPQFTQRDAAIYASLTQFDLAVQTLRLVLVRPNSADTLADTTVTIAEDQDSVLVEIAVELEQPTEQLSATLEMRSGSILVFAGTRLITARAGAQLGGAPPVLVPVWVGPGANATRVEAAPSQDFTMSMNGSAEFTAVAYTADNAPVTDPDFVGRLQWAVSDTSLASIPRTGGALTGKGKTGDVFVTVMTPNLLRDTVKVTLVTLGTPARLAYSRGLEIVDRDASSTVPVVVQDDFGGTIPSAAITYESRTPSVATVASNGAITGVAIGQAVIVASLQNAPSVKDSLLAVVTEPGGPVVLTSMDRFQYAGNADVTVSVYVDMRAGTRKLGSTTIDVDWDPAQLQFVSSASGGSGVTPTVNSASASTGRLTLAMADVNGFAGRVELLRITFRTSTATTTGTLRATAREVNGADYADLLPITFQVVHAIRIN